MSISGELDRIYFRKDEPEGPTVCEQCRWWESTTFEDEARCFHPENYVRPAPQPNGVGMTKGEHKMCKNVNGSGACGVFAGPGLWDKLLSGPPGSRCRAEGRAVVGCLTVILAACIVGVAYLAFWWHA